MKNPQELFSSTPNSLKLPNGIIGIPSFKEAEILYSEKEIPFMRLRETKEDGLEFIVVNPVGNIPDYQIKISTNDLASLGINDQNECFILNIVTIHQNNNNNITANLVAPLLFNRKTLQGKQIIIENSTEYSPQHLLYDTSQPKVQKTEKAESC